MKKALAVHTHFEDFVEDQFDFHTYCMRKVTLEGSDSWGEGLGRVLEKRTNELD